MNLAADLLTHIAALCHTPHVGRLDREGKAGHYALRTYIENRISYKAFSDACAVGMRIYEAQQVKA